MKRRNQKTKRNAKIVFTCAHQGMTSGLPMYAIMLQSNVKKPIPKPVEYPNSWLTTTLFGAIQQTQLNVLRAVKIYPGNQYHTKLPSIASRKNFSRLMCFVSTFP